MKLPWDNSELEEEIERLEGKIEELEDEKQRLENRFEAEKERRSKLSTEKQEAEKKLKKLKQKLNTEEVTDNEETGQKEREERKNVSLEQVRSLVEKLETVESGKDDLLTVYSPGKFSEVENLRELKNSASKYTIQKLEDRESFIAFTDELFMEVMLETRPLFESYWSLDSCFETGKLEEIIESEKTWVILSAGNSRIVKEENGEIREVQEVDTRVDRKHTQGGFSQSRFERKREEQIQNHLDAVREALETEEPLLVGEQRLCKQLEGDYLGGFDDNRPMIDALYSFRLIKCAG